MVFAFVWKMCGSISRNFEEKLQLIKINLKERGICITEELRLEAQKEKN